MELSDEALCRRVAERDEEAFDLLVTRYQERAYRMAWSLLGSADEARDLSQEAFLKLYQSARAFRGSAQFSTWFYRILVNLCIDHRRKRRGWRRLFVSTDTGEAGTPVEEQPAQPQDQSEALSEERVLSLLWSAVDRLAPRQRAAVLLYAREGLRSREIALALNCSEATARVHLHRALTHLRKTIGGAVT